MEELEQTMNDIFLRVADRKWQEEREKEKEKELERAAKGTGYDGGSQSFKPYDNQS